MEISMGKDKALKRKTYQKNNLQQEKRKFPKHLILT
jgi:hypothetical protein